MLITLWTVAIATAHPLGNFTISHYTRLETGADGVRLRYIVDYAEVAAFQELQTADSDSDGTFSEAEKSAWLARVIPQWLNGLRLTANGQPLAVARHQSSAHVAARRGQPVHVAHRMRVGSATGCATQRNPH
jgi:hypothetical protein